MQIKNCTLSSLLTKKQDKKMNEETEKQQDTENHLVSKLTVGTGG
jgi:hypothetical protein